MKNNHNRPIAIIVILAISLTVGLLVNTVWNALDRAVYPRKYMELVSKYAAEYNLPEDVIYATIKVESSFDPDAISRAGARGLMQMMPSTFEWLTSDEHLGEHLTPNMLFDPETNIKIGTAYIKYLSGRFNDSPQLILAAYNGGEGNVARWLADPEYSDENGNLIFISKECASNGCAATVDVTYPSIPMFLKYAPEYVFAME